MKIIGVKMIDGKKTTAIVECTCMEIAGHGEHDFDVDDCRVLLHTAHPNVRYFIIKTERSDKTVSGIRPYRWLNIAEAEAIVKCAAESDAVDLRKLGAYQLIYEGKIQSVYIMNDIDDWTDEEIPLLVQSVGEKRK